MDSMPKGERGMLWIMGDIFTFKSGDARVVDDYMKRAAFGEYLCCYPLPVRFFSDVKATIGSLSPEGSDNGFALRIVDVRHIDARTIGDKSAGDGFTDAACRARDQGNFSFKTFHELVFLKRSGVMARQP
jgi:hypothetical protein